MITEVIDLIISNKEKINSDSELLKIIRGKYEYPNTFRKVLKKIIRKIKKIE